MRSFYALLGVAAVLGLPALSGCGETVLDTTKTEEQLKASLGKSLGTKITSVDCPSGEKVEAGRTFTCSVTLSEGKEETATLKIRNEDADISVIKLSGGNE